MCIRCSGAVSLLFHDGALRCGLSLGFDWRGWLTRAAVRLDSAHCRCLFRPHRHGHRARAAWRGHPREERCAYPPLPLGLVTWTDAARHAAHGAQEGSTALDIAKMNYRKDIIKLLKRAAVRDARRLLHVHVVNVIGALVCDDVRPAGGIALARLAHALLAWVDVSWRSMRRRSVTRRLLPPWRYRRYAAHSTSRSPPLIMPPLSAAGVAARGGAARAGGRAGHADAAIAPQKGRLMQGTASPRRPQEARTLHGWWAACVSPRAAESFALSCIIQDVGTCYTPHRGPVLHALARVEAKTNP